VEKALPGIPHKFRGRDQGVVDQYGKKPTG
jgi:hypothetical protein